MKKILLILLFIYSGQLAAQQILIDRGIRINGLWCFSLHTDANTYLYLPVRARLALDEQKEPKFSFMRYITEREGEENSSNTLTQAGGGGILHFLVLYDTPEAQIQGAEAALREKLQNDEIRIRGPIVFDKGNYTLISSILNRNTGKEEQKILSTGEAPVLENSSIALSFELNPLDSKILLESFKMDTPDISFIFELGFSGLSDSYDATLEIDWGEVRKSKSFGAGGSLFFVSADVEAGFDELIKNNAIRLVTAGTHKSMESLLNTVYNRLLEVMFKPVEAESVPLEQRGDMGDALDMIKSAGSLLSGKIGFGLHASYQIKELRVEGTSNLFFKGRSTVKRNHFITFNIGDLYQKYGQDRRFFRDVPIWDPAFDQRDVYIGIDGDLEKEFEDMLNSVSVTIRKKHGNGAETLADILIKKESFKDYEGKLSMRYLNHGDSIRTHWLNYEWKAIWKFKGGGSYETPWKNESASMINLFVPFQRKTIHLDGDLKALEEKNIRAVSVKISYPFFDRVKQHRLTIRPQDNLSGKKFGVTLPNAIEDINYTITWIPGDASIQTLEGTDNFGIIFIDEIPEQQ